MEAVRNRDQAVSKLRRIYITIYIKNKSYITVI